MDLNVQPDLAAELHFARVCRTVAKGRCVCSGACMLPFTPQEKKIILQEELAYVEYELQRTGH